MTRYTFAHAEIRDTTLTAAVSPHDAVLLLEIHLTESADLIKRGRFDTAWRHMADAQSLLAALTVAKAHTDAARAIVAADGRGWAMGRTNPVSFL